MKSILVTGGAGYIGSHTCKHLAKAGYHPIVLDNLSTGHAWAVKWGPLVVGDVSDRRLVRNVIREHRIDSVIHFAANASVGESMVDPFRYLHDNVAGSLALLEAMRETDIGHIVFSSTCATYGIPGQMPIRETEPQVPVNSYGESKLYVERALSWFEQAHGISWAALRYFNAAGADPEGQLGECHDPETHLIPLAIQASLGTGPAIRIFGRDYATQDGTCIRDFVHVDDLAEAHIRALEHLRRGGKSIALNLGTGRGYSVREVIASVEKAGGRPVPVLEAPRRPGDPPRLVADNRLAQETLRWQPRYCDLDFIVRTAWEWQSLGSRTRLNLAVGA